MSSSPCTDGPVTTPVKTLVTTPPSTDRHAHVKGYTVETLKGIDSQCGSRLPPASAMQAMFLYEMQRQTEDEKLFHAQLFQLAKDEADKLAQDRRIRDLEDRLKKLVGEAAPRDQLRHYMTSTTHVIQTQLGKVNECVSRLDGAEKKLDQVDKLLETLQLATMEAASAATKAGADATAAAAAIEELATSMQKKVEVSTMKEEINVLFDDRDGILRMVNGITARVEVLQGSVRALTLQRSPSGGSPGSPGMSQRLPLRTVNGTLDLSIPKGSPLVSLGRENRAP